MRKQGGISAAKVWVRHRQDERYCLETTAELTKFCAPHLRHLSVLSSMTDSAHSSLDANALLSAYQQGQRNFQNIRLVGQSLEGANLRGIDFQGAQFQNVSFKGAKLIGVNFQGADLKQTDFSQATLYRVSFNAAKFEDINVEKTTLRYTTFSNAQLKRAAFIETQFHGVNFEKALIQAADFNKTHLRKGNIHFQGTTLDHANFIESRLKQIDFSTCANLKGTRFSGAWLNAVSFKAVNLQGCNFSNAKIYGVDFKQANLTGATFEYAHLGTTPEPQKIINWIKFILYYSLIFFGLLSMPTAALAMQNGAVLPFTVDEGIGWIMLASLLIAIPITLALLRRRNNFYKAKLISANFSNAKLESVNLNQANCSKAKFTGSQTGVHFKRIRSAAFVYASLTFAFFGTIIAYATSSLVWSILDTLKVPQVGPESFTLILVIIVLAVGFLYFITIGMLKHMSEAILGIPITALTLLLATSNQPIITGFTWAILIIAIFRIFKTLFIANRILTAITIFLLLATAAIIYFRYRSILNSDLSLLQDIPAALVIIVLVSLRTAVTVAEMGFFTHWGHLSIILLAAIPSFPLIFSLLVAGFIDYRDFQNTSYGVTMIVDSSGLLLGTWLGLYLGWQALRDKENYRIIRDRGIWFCHWFGQFGTHFKGANLAAADFSFATLNNADFSNADLTHIQWYGALKLEAARFGRRYLRYPAVRKLLSRKRGLLPQTPKRARRFVRRYHRLPRPIQTMIHGQLVDPTPSRFDHFHLQGIRLSHWDHPGTMPIAFWGGLPVDWLSSLVFLALCNAAAMNLSKMSFEGADLRHADLRGANLTQTNLSQSQLNHADLRYTTLTDVCIRDWQITPTTRFEGTYCERLYLDQPEPGTEEQVSTFLGDRRLSYSVLEQLLMKAEDVDEINEIKKEFAQIDLVKNKINREYKLNQFANQAQDRYQLNADRYRQMFDYYKQEKRRAERQQSWWKSILWFNIEPWIERANQLTQELDIFPLLENLGRLSILVAVITFVNSTLKPDVDLEQYYRSWEIIHSDTEEVRGVRRFALEQLRTAEGSLVGISAPGENLERINLSGADLTDANLSRAILVEANLSQSTLVRANLAGADLRRARLNHIDQSRDSVQQQFGGFAFPTPDFLVQGANLQDADLRDADLRQADLRHADLRSAFLGDGEDEDTFGAILSEADMRDADLRSADLRNADLSFVDLRSANLSGANLHNAYLDDGTRLEGATFCETTLPDGTVNNDDCGP